jgi:hypothetical protein
MVVARATFDEAGNALNDVNVFATFEWGRTVRCTY